MQTLIDRNDRMNTYNGLEVRTPFCDYRIVDYAYNMPWKYKAHRGREKGIVREAMQEILPHDVVWRKKSPYPKTHNPVYFKLVSKKIKKILKDKHSFLYQIVNKENIEEIIKHPEKIESPWYGQLMKAPQMLAYLIQIEQWVSKNNITII
jgi:asparagine synthase (glutamine-hydrolysing)